MSIINLLGITRMSDDLRYRFNYIIRSLRKIMEKKVAFVSFGGEAGKFYNEDFHLHLDGSNFNKMIRHLPNNEIWIKYDLPEYEHLCDLNGWDKTEKEVLRMYVSLDQTGWNGCSSAWESLDKVFEGYHYTQPNDLYIPASVVRNMLKNTDDKVIDVIIPWWKWISYDEGKRDVKNFKCELHMVDALEQLPERL